LIGALVMLLVTFAIIVAVIVGFVVLIVRLVKPKSVHSQGVPGTPTTPAPGWYPDPNDSSLMRYFDGRVWTSSTQPWG
jgi:MFS superfamily sulfate permease-like transporter